MSKIYTELPEWREKFAALQATVDGFYDGIKVGRRSLRDIFGDSSFREKVANISDNGIFISRGNGIIDNNTIYLNPRTLKSEERLLSIELHERTHALQFSQAAALQASPSVPDNDIILCPRDYIWAFEAAERDAPAKQMLFAAELAALEPKREAALRAAMPMLDRFLRAKRKYPRDIHRALAEAGEARMASQSDCWDDCSIKSYYNRLALRIYKSNIAERKNQAITFVRLEAEDIIAIGSTYGINSLGPDGGLFPEFQKATKLSFFDRIRLGILNYRLKIKNEDETLPTLGQALAARGMDRQAFLAKLTGRAPQPAA